MTDHAVLIPTPEGPVGGIVSAPEGEPRAGVVLMQGYGHPARSGINSFWTRTARDLAAHGLVALRVDYAREGETLPIGVGVSGQAPKNELDTRLFDCVLRWFVERLEGLDLFLAGACAGGRGVIEVAGRDPAAFAGVFVVVPYLRLFDSPGPKLGEPPENGDMSDSDRDAVDPALVEHMRAILAHSDAWVLVGEHDTPNVSLLRRLVGPAAHELELEVVPGIALHFLDSPERQQQAGHRLTARVARAIAVPAGP